MLQSVYSFITEHCQRHTMLFNEKNIKCNAEFIHVKKFCKIYPVPCIVQMFHEKQFSI